MGGPQVLRSEQALDYLQAIFENSLAAVTVCDAQGNITAFNHMAERLTAYSADEVLGQSVARFYRASEFEMLQAQVVAEGRVEAETVLQTRDGAEVAVSIVILPLVSPAGEAYGSLGITVDITERKALEADLRQAREEAETYCDLLVHDITNHVQSCFGYLELLLTGQPGPLTEAQRHHLVVAHRAMRRASHLARQVSVLSHQEETLEQSTEELDLQAALDDVLRAVRERWPDRELVVVQRDTAAARVRGVPLLAQALDNLLDNAVRHHGAGPVRLWLQLAEAELDGASAWALTLADDGPGLPADPGPLLDRFSCGPGGRSGLGLAVTGVLVRSSGGRIELGARQADEPGSGACFVLTLPQATPGADAGGER